MLPAEMRAAFVKTNLQGLDALAARQGMALRGDVRPETLAAIEGALRTSWLPVELDVELTEVVDKRLGRRLSAKWAKDALRTSLDGPLFRPLIDGAVQLFGLSPAAFARFFPKGWGFVYRGCGEMRVVESTPVSVTLLHSDVADAIHASAAYRAGIAASIEAALELNGVQATVEIDLGPRTLTFIGRWPAGR